MELLRTKPARSFIDNPFDLTGASGFDKELLRQVVYADSDVGFVLAPWNITFPDDTGLYAPNRMIMDVHHLAAHETGPRPSVPRSRRCPGRTGSRTSGPRTLDVAIVRGLETTIRALSWLGSDRAPGQAETGQVREPTMDHPAARPHRRGRLPGDLGQPRPAARARRDLRGVEAAVGLGRGRIRLAGRDEAGRGGSRSPGEVRPVKVGCRDRPSSRRAITAAIQALARARPRPTATLSASSSSGRPRAPSFCSVCTALSLGAFVTIARGGDPRRAGTFSRTYRPAGHRRASWPTRSAKSPDCRTMSPPGCQAATAATATPLLAVPGRLAQPATPTVEINPALVSARGVRARRRPDGDVMTPARGDPASRIAIGDPHFALATGASDPIHHDRRLCARPWLPRRGRTAELHLGDRPVPRPPAPPSQLRPTALPANDELVGRVVAAARALRWQGAIWPATRSPVVEEHLPHRRQARPARPLAIHSVTRRYLRRPTGSCWKSTRRGLELPGCAAGRRPGRAGGPQRRTDRTEAAVASSGASSTCSCSARPPGSRTGFTSTATTPAQRAIRDLVVPGPLQMRAASAGSWRTLPPRTAAAAGLPRGSHRSPAFCGTPAAPAASVAEPEIGPRLGLA